jgi:bifunctional non-homologous end joining protein LigD
MEWSVTKRTGKIFLDHNMNALGKTLGAAYSPRALPNQSLSMPLTWDELEGAYPDDFTMRNAFDWLDRRGDVWEDILDAKVNVASLFGAS